MLKKESLDQYEKFIERFENRDFPQALRDLRALIQDAQEYVLTNYQIPIPDNQNVSKFAHQLARENIIDGRLLNWFLAFTSIANLSSHGDFPNQQELKDPKIKDRVRITFRLGLHLLKELNYTLIKPIEAQDVSFKILKD